ncbi:4a-hydroxytetrahydrobiopterin dehydratase [Oceanobacter antarcticus]|uniref:4a-hydroxytetrahydrobiopterin dehydratase n=1 Tax=Oceanobacter antarcticus TaxID=3133425 RepID=A0ABW8NKT6_9GAMM
MTPSSLTQDEIVRVLAGPLSAWELISEENQSMLQRKVKTQNFGQSLGLANRTGELAEEQNHHP